MIENILFNKWQTFTEFNQTGLTGIFTYPADTWSAFIPLVLFGLFVIVLLSTFFTQKRLTGRDDFFASLAVAGFFTAVIAIIMGLVDGLVDNYTLTITIMVAIVAVILLFFTRDR